MKLWSIQRQGGLVELRAWTYDEIVGWITRGPRILASSFNCARVLVPRGVTWARSEGEPGSAERREWWAAPGVAA